MTAPLTLTDWRGAEPADHARHAERLAAADPAIFIGAPAAAGGGIPLAVKMAEMAVKMRRMSGLGTSRVSDFFKPPNEIIEEFMAHPKGL